MVIRKISEMYDMKTTLNRMGVVGIHTPTWGSIDKRWHGDFLNNKFYRVLGCNVRMACASALPPDPLQIGVSGHAVAPQDIMNPILYRAVSNETWNLIIGRLFGSTDITIDKNSVKSIADAFTQMSDDDVEAMYYALLSSNEWRKAMPQSGLSVKGLKPFVYPIYGMFGNGEVVSQTTPIGQIIGTKNTGVSSAVQTSGSNVYSDRVIRGRAVRMPRFACSTGGIDYMSDTYLANIPVDTPRTFVMALVLPPAKLTVFYFRLIVDWYIQFSEPVSLLEKLNGPALASDGEGTYTRQYEFSSAKDLGGKDSGSVSTIEADMDLVMEK